MLSVTDFVQKRIISGVRIQAGLHLDMLDADRLLNMQSVFLPELHRWISKLTARHLHACPSGDLLIPMVKETVIFLYKKEFQKMKKSRISPWSERDENAKWLRDCLWLCQACKRGFTCRRLAYVKKSSPGSTATHKPTSAQPLSAPHSDQRDIQLGTVKLSRWRHWLNFIKTNGAAPRAAKSALQRSRLNWQLHQLWKSFELHERSKLDELARAVMRGRVLIAVFYHFLICLFFVSLGALHNPERSINSRVLSTPASSNVLMIHVWRRFSSL